MNNSFTLVIHGGSIGEAYNSALQDAFLEEVLRAGLTLLKGGASALDSVTDAVRRMEDSGLYCAGKGAGPNTAGYAELDASIMDGKTGMAGAVAGLRTVRNPVLAARAVMEKTPHVFLAGAGAEAFARRESLDLIDDPAAYFCPAPLEPLRDVTTGTVGAVALDRAGNLAAATSTGGVPGKWEGRVGDTPIIGAATFATPLIAVSTTGRGEYFIRAVAAHSVAVLHETGLSLQDAVDRVRREKIEKPGGRGGFIAIDKSGAPAFSFTGPGMHRGYVQEDGIVHAGSYADLSNNNR